MTTLEFLTPEERRAICKEACENGGLPTHHQLLKDVKHAEILAAMSPTFRAAVLRLQAQQEMGL